MGLRIVHNMLPGRLRIRADELRGDKTRLHRIIQELRDFAGISNVETNPVTGGILVHYDVSVFKEWDLLSHISGKSGLPLDSSDTEPRYADLPEAKGIEIPRLARAVEEPFQRLNTGLFRMTNGYMDFRYLLPVLLMAYGTSKLIRLGPVPAIPWYLLYWWSFRTFVLLNRQMKPS